MTNKPFWRRPRVAIGWLLSPTWMLAHSAKADLRGATRSRLIRSRNVLYLRVSLGVAAIAQLISMIDGNLIHRPALLPVRIIVAAYLISRCNEVFYAFYRDALEKIVSRSGPKSSLSWARRLRLALNSYAELIVDFALLYFLLPKGAFQPEPASLADHLFYSASTITTSGGGGVNPHGVAARLLTDYEIFCGLILLVVCFAVYVGRALSEKEGRS